MSAPNADALRSAPVVALLGFVLGGSLDTATTPLGAAQVLSRLVGLLARIVAGKATATKQDAADAAAMAARCGYALDALATGEAPPDPISAEMVSRVALAIAAEDREASRDDRSPYASSFEVGLRAIGQDECYRQVIVQRANDPEFIRAYLAEEPHREPTEALVAEFLMGLDLGDRRVREERSDAVDDPEFLRDLLPRLEATTRAALIERWAAKAKAA